MVGERVCQKGSQPHFNSSGNQLLAPFVIVYVPTTPRSILIPTVKGMMNLSPHSM